MSATVLSLVPVFALLLVGYLAGRAGRIDFAGLPGINVLAIEFLIPAAEFRATSETPRAALVAHLPFCLCLLASMLAMYAIAWAVCRRGFGFGAGEASVISLVIGFPNLAAVGLPLSAAVFGHGGQVHDALGIGIGAIFTVPITLAILEATTHAEPGGIGRVLGRALTRPVVVAPVLGVALSFAAILLPAPVRGTVALLAVATGGVTLVLTGLILSFQAFRPTVPVLVLVAVKNLLHPALALALGLAAGLDGTELRALVVLSAVPCGFFGVLFGLRFGISSEVASSTLLLSNAASAITLTGTILLLPP